MTSRAKPNFPLAGNLYHPDTWPPDRRPTEPMPELANAEEYIAQFAFVYPEDAVWAFLEYPRLKQVLIEVGTLHYYSDNGVDETYQFDQSIETT